MNRRPKIAVVVPKYGLVGGAERFAAEVTGHLAASTDYEFHVFAHRWESNNNSPVKFHRIRRLPFPRSLRPWAFAWQVDRAVRCGDFDLVHSHDRIFAADIVSLHCTPHRTWVRDILRKRISLFDRSTIAVERRLIENGSFSTFIAVSSLSAELFRREYPNSKGRWTLMGPGVDYARFSVRDRESCRREIRARHGIAPEARVVLFVGMNFELKGLDTVMGALAKAIEWRQDAKFHLLVIGKGNAQKYHAEAARRGMASAVTFTGTVTSGLEQYYRASDCLMMLSTFDTFGMVVLEAMAAGLPVIVSHTVGARDIVDEGQNGYVLRSTPTAEAAAEALIKATNEGRFAFHSRLARETARQHSWLECANQMRSIYTAHLDGTGKDK